MVKTQVQIPDNLYESAKRIARENEMSFAEVVRRGLEEIVKHHPPMRQKASEWSLPVPIDLGAPLLKEEEWTEVCHEEL